MTMEEELPMSQCKKWTLYMIALSESILFGGNIYGWAQLAFILKEEGIYSYLCQNNATADNSERAFPEVKDKALFKGCKEQDLKFTLAYVCGTFAFSFGSFLVGDFLFKFGLRITRLVSGPLVVFGFIILGEITKDKPHLLFVGITILSVGNCGIRAVGVQFAELFPKKNSALSLISGSFASSAGLFLLIQIATAQGISRSHACWFFAGVSALFIPATFLMPKDRIVPHNKLEPKPEESKLIPIKSSLLSVSIFLNYFWAAASFLNLNIMSTLFNPWISDISETNTEASIYSSLFSFGTFFCILFAFAPGFLTDIFSKILSSDGSEQGDKIRNIRSCFCSLLLTTALFITMMGCLFFRNSIAIYIGVFCLSYCRPTLISVWSNFVRARFAIEHLDRLVGYGIGLSMLDGPFAYLVILWSQANYYQALTFVFCLEVAALSFPLHILSTKYLKKVTQPK